MSKVIVVGSSNTDMVIKSERLPVPGETILGGDFIMNPGGKGANQAVAAARLGGDVVFIAKVGDDVFGREAVAGFEKDGIDTSLISVDADHASGAAVIMVDEAGENCISVASGANFALGPDDVKSVSEKLYEDAVLLMQLETPLETVIEAAQLGREKGMIIILNPAPAQKLPDELVSKLDLITPNETEAELLTGIEVKNVAGAEKAAEVLQNMGVGAVIITMGSDGAYLRCPDFTGIIPVERVQCVDTTAAGDTFNGALSVGIARGMALPDAVKFANAAATISVQRMGAQTSVPTLREVEVCLSGSMAEGSPHNLPAG